jgi:hypothetical protein
MGRPKPGLSLAPRNYAVWREAVKGNIGFARYAATVRRHNDLCVWREAENLASAVKVGLLRVPLDHNAAVWINADHGAIHLNLNLVIVYNET